MRLFRSAVLLVSLCLLAWPALALELVPFQVRNMTPTALVHAPAPAEAARLLAPGTVKASFSLDLASHAIENSTGNEQVVIDGETLMATLGLRYAINEQLQVGFDLPWIRHDEGSLDSFISNWHDFFFLPDGDRDDLPEDQLLFGYQRDEATELQLDQSTDGIGDLRLISSWQLSRDAQTATALHASLKVPTGDADKLTGSDSWGASLALSADRQIPLTQGQIAFWGGLGGSWLGNSEVLDSHAEDWAANAWLGAGWSPREWIDFKLQLDAHTALYDSALAELGDLAVILTMGGDLALGPQTSLEIGVGEDIAVGTSPDVTFHLGLTHCF